MVKKNQTKKSNRNYYFSIFVITLLITTSAFFLNGSISGRVIDFSEEFIEEPSITPSSEDEIEIEAYNTTQTNQTNQTTQTTQTTTPSDSSSGSNGGSKKKCIPSKTCTDYSMQCGAALSNGCTNTLDCSLSCDSNRHCDTGVCVLSCSNATGCSLIGDFCDATTPYNCSMNESSGCLIRQDNPDCSPTDCYAGYCLFSSQINSCTELNSPGYYILNTSITNNSLSTSCISITSAGIVLDCNNTQISSTNNSVTGIYSNSTTKIKNCQISLGIMGGTTSKGIEIQNGTGSTITNNTIDSADEGIYTKSTNNSIISENIITSSWVSGLHILQGHNNTVENNIISLTSSYGMLLTGSSENQISGNNLFSNFWFGIAILESSGESPDGKNNISQNNISSSSYHGISIQTSGNTLFQNIIDQTSFLGSGIFVTSADNNTLQENTIINTFYYGINIWNAAWTTIINNNVSSSVSGLTIKGSNSTNNTITNNTFCSNTVDVTCELNQTFEDNTCDSGTVCGGICIEDC